jgi:hypothetical protein
MKMLSRALIFVLFSLSAIASAQTVVTTNAPVTGDLITSITTSWAPPTQRENNEPLPAAELGGYELRYKKASDTAWTNIRLPKTATSHVLRGQPMTNYEFQIAAFDTKELYSVFVPLTYAAPVRPKAPGDFKVTTVGTSANVPGTPVVR